MRAAAWLGIGALVGCDAVLGIEKLPADPDAGARASVAYASATCRDCAATSCAALVDACVADTSCAPLYRCEAACPLGDVRCRAGCRTLHKDAAAAPVFREVDACERRGCALACYGDKGAGQLLTPTCKCSEDACTEAMLACVRSGHDRPAEVVGACERRYGCMLLGQNPDTYMRCLESTADGEPELNALTTCINRSRCAECGVGRDFSCGGKFSYSALPSQITSIDYELILNNFSRKALPDVHAKVCPFDCADCTGGSDAGPSDESGVLRLKLPTPRGGFEGCLHLSRPDMLPAIYYAGRRLAFKETHWYALMTEPLLAQAFAAKASVTLDSTKGIVAGLVYDCAVFAAEGLLLDPIGSSKALYADRDTFALDAPTTTVGGAFLFLNVEPGTRTVVARKDGAVVARHDVAVKAGTTTSVYLFPLSK